MSTYKRPERRTFTIPNAGDTSEAVGMMDYLLAGFVMPASLTSTAMTFLVCDTHAGTFIPLYDHDDNQVSVDVAASRGISLTGVAAEALAPWPWVKLKMGSSEGAERTIIGVIK